jgi:asparagine synthase (glutamine-hydrolysing)
MCGIGGYVCFNNSRVTVEILSKLTDSISHRGPDGFGHWINNEGNVGLGHRRLSIIDLSNNASQPMHFADKRYTITFNGEIYNYIEIKKNLLSKGYKFSSESDTEVLLALYDLKKEECLSDLNGMFAFAIWDEQEKVLFCARDRFGEKPFHYYQTGNEFVFASEIKQFFALGIQKRIIPEKVNEFVKTGVVDSVGELTQTFYENIKRLDAAHYMTINSKGKIQIKKYWEIDLNIQPFKGTIDEAAFLLKDLFADSVKLRLRSDVPVGSSLSGGLDSSSIVMMINRMKGDTIKQNTFSARFKDFDKDEGSYIEEVIKASYNINAHYIWPDADYFSEVIEKVSYYQDEPYGSASIIAQYAVMQLANEHKVTVLLDGQGADEIMAGYIPYYHLYLRQLSCTNKSKFKTECKLFNELHSSNFQYTHINQVETLRMRLGRYRRILFNQRSYLNGMLRSRLKNDATVCGLKELLRYADRNSMAHSREVRLPFLDHRLVEFIFSLPDSFILHKGWTKYILRKSMNDVLPESIAWRVDKIGYEPPQSRWIETDYFIKRINQTAKDLGIKRESKVNKTVFNSDWRLLVSSFFMS